MERVRQCLCGVPAEGRQRPLLAGRQAPGEGLQPLPSVATARRVWLHRQSDSCCILPKLAQGYSHSSQEQRLRETTVLSIGSGCLIAHPTPGRCGSDSRAHHAYCAQGRLRCVAHCLVCPEAAGRHGLVENCGCVLCLQAQLVYEAGQIKGSIAMTHPDRIHAGRPGGGQHGGGDSRGSFCHGTVDSKPAAHLLEMVRSRCATRVEEYGP